MCANTAGWVKFAYDVAGHVCALKEKAGAAVKDKDHVSGHCAQAEDATEATAAAPTTPEIIPYAVPPWPPTYNSSL